MIWLAITFLILSASKRALVTFSSFRISEILMKMTFVNKMKFYFSDFENKSDDYDGDF